MNKNLFVLPTETIKTALKKLDLSSKKVLFVIDQNSTLLGTLSDGDIRRSILNGCGLVDPITHIYNTAPTYFLKHEYTAEKAKRIFLKTQIELIPILDDSHQVVDYVTWDLLFSQEVTDSKPTRKINAPVVIMAGGRGSRLIPFTYVLPKPLIPIGEKTIVERIIDNFKEFGVDTFYLTLNYRGEMIKAYFDGLEKSYRVEYLWEEEFCGTAGSLSLLPAELPDEFIVSNCDIIVKADYYDILDYHRKNKAALTLVSSIQHYTIPYGIVEYKAGGEVSQIKEKPEYSFPINTGVYIINKNCLKLIPENTVFHMTDLIAELIKNKQNVYMYPVNEKDYIDIGQWEEYQKVIDLFQKNGAHDH